jgi:type VI secretion system protein ImpK
MSSPAAVNPADLQAEPARRRGTLALVLQEAITAIVRLRANRQAAADAESFRAHLKQLLAAADDQARRAGYDQGTVKRAIYAATVFLDESVLNSSQPMFADWPRKPLQEEIFGGHMGGEVFFQNLRELLGRPDSEDLADLLEVHQICMLLGFKGRYTLGDTGELRSFMGQTGEKIHRIRGGHGPLGPQWAPLAGESLPVTLDPWLQRLVMIAAGTTGAALLFLIIFLLVLQSGVSDIAALVKVPAP